jgi:hypothetical protein
MGSCCSSLDNRKKENQEKEGHKNSSDIRPISELTKGRLSLLVRKFKIYKEVNKMLNGSMDDANGIKIGNGINGMGAGNGVNAKKTLEALNGVAHT